MVVKKRSTKKSLMKKRSTKKRSPKKRSTKKRSPKKQTPSDRFKIRDKKLASVGGIHNYMRIQNQKRNARLLGYKSVEEMNAQPKEVLKQQWHDRRAAYGLSN
jgi:hypothetical protein